MNRGMLGDIQILIILFQMMYFRIVSDKLSWGILGDIQIFIYIVFYELRDVGVHSDFDIIVSDDVFSDCFR